MFKVRDSKVLLFKSDKVYELVHRKETPPTRDDLLDYLSGEQYKTSSHIYSDNTDQLLATLTGTVTTSTFYLLFSQFEKFI